MEKAGCDEELTEVLTTAGIGTQQVEALKLGLPAMGVTDLHSFAYARKALDPNGINSQHEREYAAGKVCRRALARVPHAKPARSHTQSLLELAARCTTLYRPATLHHFVPPCAGAPRCAKGQRRCGCG